MMTRGDVLRRSKPLPRYLDCTNTDLVAYLVCSGYDYREAVIELKEGGAKRLKFIFPFEAQKTAMDWQLNPKDRRTFKDQAKTKAVLDAYVEAVGNDTRFNKPTMKPGQVWNVPPKEVYA